jgi:hypothetical protein
LERKKWTSAHGARFFLGRRVVCVFNGASKVVEDRPNRLDKIIGKLPNVARG